MTRPRSVRTYLIGLILCVVVPLQLFSGGLVLRGARHEQDAMAARARYQTRAAAAAIDDELFALRARLFQLAGRLSLQTSDLDTFHGLARQEFDGLTVTLVGPGGQEILNSGVAYGTPLPTSADLETIRFVVETQTSRLGTLVTDPVTGRPSIAINVPVTRDSQLVYVLSLDVLPVLPELLTRLDLPDGWLASIFDRQGTIVGRTQNPGRYVGRPARADFIRAVAAGQDGWIEGTSQEGVPVFTAFARTKSGNWTIGAAIPRTALLEPVRRSVWWLVLAGGGTLALAVGLAALIARRIAAPITALVPAAGAVGQATIAPVPMGVLAEADAVARSLFNADERLRLAAEEQHHATAALRDSEQRYRALAEELERVDRDRGALLVRVIAAQEEERKRIARELHDSLAQHLTALRLKLAGPRPGGAAVPDAARLADLTASLDSLGQAVHRLAWELRPVALDELGLHQAVNHYLEEWADMAHIEVATIIRLNSTPIPAAVETTLFRVLQEATANIARHAEASHAGVILEAGSDEVRMIVEDNGKGFAAEDASAGRLGLLGMRERLALVNGVLDVETTKDRGTALFVRIPLPAGRPAS